MNRLDKFSRNSANKIRLVQIMCCIMFSVTLQPSSAGDITTTCPSSYVEAVASQVNCTADLNAFAASGCINSPDDLSFYFTPSGSAEQFWCSTSIVNCGSTKRNDPACNNCSCGCLDDSTQSAAEYRLIFLPEQQIHAGGTFSCNITCALLPGATQPSSSNVQCAPIGPIEIPSTTQPPTASTNASQTTAQTTSHTTASTNANQTTVQTTSDTTASTNASHTTAQTTPDTTATTNASQTTQASGKTDGGCCPGSACAYGVGFGVTICVIVITVIIGIMVKKKLAKRKCNNKSASSENPQQGQGGQNQNGSNAKPPPPATGVPSETEGGDTNKYTGTGNSPKRPHTTEEKVELSTVGQPSTGSPSDEASKPSRPLPTPRKPEPLPSGTVPMPSVETNSRANPLPPIEKKPVMAV